MSDAPVRLVICGAAGRDFHNFNVRYRDDPRSSVVAFTAAQIPGIADRRYPPALAGARYPAGIPILSETELEATIRREHVDRVAFAYSDVSHAEVMHLASKVLAAGAEFAIDGPATTMLKASKPVIAVSAVRTGCGKSQIARFLSSHLRSRGLAVAAIRHPMPYGDLAAQAVQRFANADDLDHANCTLEEREEYEPHIAAGNVVYAGVDYAEIVRAADSEADVLVWDGGNNDFPFIDPDFHVVVVDALRPTHLASHHPGEAVLRMADVVVINKVDAATPAQLATVRAGLDAIVPDVPRIEAKSPVRADSEIDRGARVLVVEDGPTLTHGGMAYGAGMQAIRGLDVRIVDPRASAPAAMLAIYQRFPHLGAVLPAMGYGAEQRELLRQTIDDSDADIVVVGTPIDLVRDVGISKAAVRVRYSYQDPNGELQRRVETALQLS